MVNALVDSGVSAAPVVDAEGRVVGVVSEADLLHQEEAVGAVAADLMTAPAVVIEPGASIASAARRLESERIKRMAVVDAQRRLVGIVSRRDLLWIHTRTDADIRSEIANHVLLRTLWIDPATIEVDVADGVVSLTGCVESRSLAALMFNLVSKVAGVVEVVDRLTWDRDDSLVVRSAAYPFGTPEPLMRPSTH